MLGFVKKRYPILFAVCCVLAIGSMIAYSVIPSMMVEASVANDFTVTAIGDLKVAGDATNVRAMIVDWPAPVADTTKYPGGYLLSGGETLTAFGANDRFADVDHDGDTADFASTDMVVNSPDDIISSAEVIREGGADLTNTWGNWQFADNDHDNAQDYDAVTNIVELLVNSADTTVQAAEISGTGPADLVAFNASGTNYYLETDANSTYNDGEDIIKMIRNGINATADGDVIRLFGPDDFYSDANSSSGYTNGELIVSSADANLDSGDTIATPGAVKNALSTPCGVGATSCKYYDPAPPGAPYCFVDDKDVSNTITTGDVLVSDACATGLGENYTFACPADAGCAGVLAGPVQKFIDDNANSEHDTGELVWNDDGDSLLETGEILFGASSTALASLSGSTDYFFNDNDAGGDSDYDNGEDIFQAYYYGDTKSIASGDVIRTFDADEMYSDADGNDDFTASAPNGTPELIMHDANADVFVTTSEVVTAGTMDLTAFGPTYYFSDYDNDSVLDAGGGNFELIAEDVNANGLLAGSEIRKTGYVDTSLFSSTLRFYDGNSNGVYTSNENIYLDNDASGYYNGDKVTAVKIGNAGSCTDAAFSRIAIWEDTSGNNAFNSGIDTMIGEITSAPFIGADISTTALSSVYTSVSNNRTVFVVIDAKSSFNGTCTFTAKIPSTGGAPYAVQTVSTNDGPTNSDVVSDGTITIDGQAPLPTDANITVTKTEVAGAAGVANPGDIITVVWDAAADGATDVVFGEAMFTEFGGGNVALEDDGAGGTCNDVLAGDDIWCATYTLVEGTVDDGGNVVYLSVVEDDVGNIAADVFDTTTFVVDNQSPTVTAGCIDVTGHSGTGGAFKKFDGATLRWDNSNSGAGCTDNNLDVVSVSFDASEFRAGDTNRPGSDTLDIWTGSLTGATDSQDDTNNNVDVSVTDDAGNVTTVSGNNNFDIDTIDPVFAVANPVVALKQDGNATASPAKSWYYYNDVAADQLRLKITNTVESDGNPLSNVRVCIKSLVNDNQGATCSGGDWGVAASVTEATVNDNTTSSINYDMQGELPSWPTLPGGYSLNVQLLDDVGNVAESTVDAQVFAGVFNIDPKLFDATINNAGTTDWKDITDFTNITGAGPCPGPTCLVFNAQVLGTDVARMTFTGALNLTDPATITAMQSFGDNVTASSAEMRIDSSAFAALDTSATLMMKMEAPFQPGLVAKDNMGAILTYIPNNAGAGPYDLGGGYGVASNFVWNGGARTLTYDVTGFSEYDSDNTPPTILGVREFDLDGNGKIDETMITFSEAISDATVTAANFTIGGTAADTVMATTSTNGFDTNTANDNVITIKKDIGILGTEQKALVYAAGTLKDLVGNSLDSATIAAGSITDSAAPVITARRFESESNNGTVDLLELDFSENTLWNGLNPNQFSVTANDLTGLAGPIADFAGNNTATFQFTPTTTSAVTGTSGVLPTIEYVRSGTVANRVQDASGNYLANTGIMNLNDSARPVIVSHSPATGAGSENLNASIVYNFSEPMTASFVYATEFTMAPNPGGWAAGVWTNGNKTVTLTHSTDFLYDTLYSITNSTGNITAANGLITDLAVAGNWSFTSMAAGRVGGGGGSSATPAVSFMINNGASETTSGSVTLSLSVSNATEMLVGNDVNFVGVTWEPATSSKVWTLPAGLGSKPVYVAVRSGAGGTISTVVSQSITVVEKAAEPTIDVDNSTLVVNKTSAKADGSEKITATVTVKMNTGAAAAGKSVVLTSSRAVEDRVNAVSATTDASGIAIFEITSLFEGVSTLMATVDGYSISKTVSIQFVKPTVIPTEEPKVELVALKVGDLIKSDASAVVYYYGADGKRHSVVNQSIFFSYYTDFSSVKTVPVDQMAGIGLGGNAKVRPGTWLIKIQTDPKVYAVEPDGIIRWIETEAVANALYGTTWNKKIIDISSAYFFDYTKGTSIDTSVHPNAALIQYDGSADIYYIMNGVKRKVADMSAFNANRFQTRFKQVVSSNLIYGNGSAISAKEDMIAEVVY
jgi:hypothetical protein